MSERDEGKMEIAVIGAGASGMAAALQAAENGAAVTLFERNSDVGRKLLVTGSGRCNLSNDAVASGKYACADPQWIDSLVRSFGVQDLIEFLRKTGILVYKTSDGWYYPLSNSAHSVVDAFQNALLRTNVTIRLKSPVEGIQSTEKGFRIKFTDDEGKAGKIFPKVIVAAGGMAHPNLGSRGELFPVLEKLGHTLVPKRPALAPVMVDLQSLKHLLGVRLDAGVDLWQGDHRLAGTAGNIIFTEWGINGPGVMDISHFIPANPGNFFLSLDFLRFYKYEFADLLQEKRKTAIPIKVFLETFFPPKVASLFPHLAQIPEITPLNQIDEVALQRLIRTLQDTRIKIRGVKGFEMCQLSAGGIPVNEVDPQTLESRIVKGLYLTGEMLDVVGPCGGFNLHFAFASGALAGRSAAGGSASG